MVWNSRWLSKAVGGVRIDPVRGVAKDLLI